MLSNDVTWRITSIKIGISSCHIPWTSNRIKYLLRLHENVSLIIKQTMLCNRGTNAHSDLNPVELAHALLINSSITLLREMNLCSRNFTRREMRTKYNFSHRLTQCHDVFRHHQATHPDCKYHCFRLTTIGTTTSTSHDLCHWYPKRTSSNELIHMRSEMKLTLEMVAADNTVTGLSFGSWLSMSLCIAFVRFLIEVNRIVLFASRSNKTRKSEERQAEKKWGNEGNEIGYGEWQVVSARLPMHLRWRDQASEDAGSYALNWDSEKRFDASLLVAFH